jgi:hypothetical protein
MTETKPTLREVSKKFSSRYLLEWVLFETNQEEAKRLAPRVRSIAERIYNLQMEYHNTTREKRYEINKILIENFVTTDCKNEIKNASPIVEELIFVPIAAGGPNFIDEVLNYLGKMTQAEYIPGSELTANPIPHTVVCPSESGITFLNIVNKKLKD